VKDTVAPIVKDRYTSLQGLVLTHLPSTSLRGLDGHLVASTLVNEAVAPTV